MSVMNLQQLRNAIERLSNPSVLPAEGEYVKVPSGKYRSGEVMAATDINGNQLVSRTTGAPLYKVILNTSFVRKGAEKYVSAGLASAVQLAASGDLAQATAVVNALEKAFFLSAGMLLEEPKKPEFAGNDLVLQVQRVTATDSDAEAKSYGLYKTGDVIDGFRFIKLQPIVAEVAASTKLNVDLTALGEAPSSTPIVRTSTKARVAINFGFPAVTDSNE